MKYPKVSIIILNYNSWEDTIECIESIKDITYPNYSIIIVDNKSCDDSVINLKERFPSLKIIESNKNLGYASGNNIGIEYALKDNSEYICILNNDAIVDKNFLEPLINIFDTCNDVAAVGPCICCYNDRDKIQAMGANINLYTGLAQARAKGREYVNFKNKIQDVDYLGGACFLVKSEIFIKIGNIPENYFLFYEETEFCLKIKRANYRLLCVGESRVYHKGSATISKFKGLSYFFLNRNRVVFERRNANLFKRIIFYLYLPIETIGRILIRKESTSLFSFYLEGIKADKNKIDFDKIKQFLN